MQKNVVKRVRLREQVPVIAAVINAEGTDGPAHPSGHRWLVEHGIRCKGMSARQLTRIDCDAFDLLIGEQGGAHHAKESWSQALHLSPTGIYHW